MPHRISKSHGWCKLGHQNQELNISAMLSSQCKSDIMCNIINGIEAMLLSRTRWTRTRVSPLKFRAPSRMWIRTMTPSGALKPSNKSMTLQIFSLSPRLLCKGVDLDRSNWATFRHHIVSRSNFLCLLSPQVSFSILAFEVISNTMINSWDHYKCNGTTIIMVCIFQMLASFYLYDE